MVTRPLERDRIIETHRAIWGCSTENEPLVMADTERDSVYKTPELSHPKDFPVATRSHVIRNSLLFGTRVLGSDPTRVQAFSPELLASKQGMPEALFNSSPHCALRWKDLSARVPPPASQRQKQLLFSESSYSLCASAEPGPCSAHPVCITFPCRNEEQKKIFKM